MLPVNKISLPKNDTTGVGDQAPVVENTVGNQTVSQGNSNPKLVQQAFHKSMFFARPRSSSMSNPNISNDGNCVDTVSHEKQNDEQSITQPPPWQRAPYKKRKICSTSPPPVITPTNNRFSDLPVDETEDTITGMPKPVNKPPKIIVNGIEDVKELIKLSTTVVEPSSVKFKIINKNLLHIFVDTAENYKKIISLYRENGVLGHTFSLKETRCYRIVIKNLHHSTPHDAIIEAIENTGNKVRGEIVNARRGPEKIPTSTFFVNIEPCSNNKEVKNIQYIYHQRVKIEDPRKSKFIVQCHRCQQYGHTKNNCMRPYRCVKCGEGHKTSDCRKKDRNTPATCALCSCDHPANYKGCTVYKEIHGRKTSKIKINQRTKSPPEQQINLDEFPQLKKQNAWINPGAEKTLKENDDNVNSPLIQHTSSIEQLLLSQSEKINSLLQQISVMLQLLTTVISKLP